uniref:ADP ribosylation factor like GTPase 14 n=1 Tax=Accipiter nisus TaxID=211598 RepID=A0A8B9P127_9AVES
MGLQSTKHSKVKQANILILGLDYAGKSTLLYKFKYNDVFLTIPTVGFNVDMIETEKDFTLTFWDVGGQQKMRKSNEELIPIIFGVVGKEGRNGGIGSLVIFL